MARTLCKILGVALLVIGFIGFASPHFLGLHLTQNHNFIHILSGALAYWFGFFGSRNSARIFCLIFGSVYLFLGILGFIKPEIVGELIQLRPLTDLGAVTSSVLTRDNIIHLALGALALIAGLIKTSQATPISNDEGVPTQT
jgi:hypothetical protein